MTRTRKAAPSQRRRLLAPLAIAVAATATLTALASGAWFTDSATSGGNSFTTGTVDISTTPTTAAFNVTAMAPGDVEYSEITVSNPGSLALRYSLTSATTGDATLASTLTREIRTAATCDAAGWAAAGPYVISASAAFNTTAVFGNPDNAQTGTPGNTGSDRVLNAGASEKLCVRVALPTSAANAASGKTVNATFTFDAVQTKNN